MATHCSILAWIIPWTEEPCGLQCMGSQSRTQLRTYHIFTYINTYIYIYIYIYIHRHRHTHTHTYDVAGEN